jgi:hypothetical protein
MPLLAKVYWSILQCWILLFSSIDIGKFTKLDWNDDGIMTCCFTIYGYTIIYGLYVVWPTSVIISRILWTTPTPSSLSSLLESYISTSSCAVAPGPVAIIACLHSFSSSGFVVVSISFTHLTTLMNFFVNYFPSSHSDDNDDAKGKITLSSTML